MVEQSWTFIDDIERQLNNKNSSIRMELISFIKTLEKDHLLHMNNEGVSGFEIILQEAKNTLINHDSFVETIAKTGQIDAVLSSTLAADAVIAWFNSNGYLLAAELLTHMENNTVVNSTYSPAYGYRVDYSPVIAPLISGTAVSGTGAFPSTATTTITKDLYYAIHYFSWSKITGNFTILDVYDFDYDKSYWSLQGLAVNVLAAEQNLGLLKPYYVMIVR